jgi:hypothetical protein
LQELYGLPFPLGQLAYLKDQAQSLTPAWLLPPLDTFVERYHAASTAEKRFEDPEDIYRMQFADLSTSYFGRPKFCWMPADVDIWALERYGLAWLDMDSIVHNLLTGPAVAFHEHALFESLARADYG